MEHRATEGFWRAYEKLPLFVKNRADKQFSLLKDKPTTPLIAI
jgi:hypothetical protein